MTARSSVTKVAQLVLRPAGARRPIVLEIADLCVINSKQYVRDAYSSWLTWTQKADQRRPLFNWVSVYNFHGIEAGDALTLSVHSRLNDQVEALMLLHTNSMVNCDEGNRGPLVFVSFVEVAPWNHPAAPDRVFHGVGPVMLRAACDLSVQFGHQGRVGLHSVLAAEEFYRRLGFQEKDCPSEHHELYLELDAAGARNLLHD